MNSHWAQGRYSIGVLWKWNTEGCRDGSPHVRVWAPCLRWEPWRQLGEAWQGEWHVVYACPLSSGSICCVWISLTPLVQINCCSHHLNLVPLESTWGFPRPENFICQTKLRKIFSTFPIRHLRPPESEEPVRNTVAILRKFMFLGDLALTFVYHGTEVLGLHWPSFYLIIALDL
jgi:hypothetical protein